MSRLRFGKGRVILRVKLMVPPWHHGSERLQPRSAPGFAPAGYAYFYAQFLQKESPMSLPSCEFFGRQYHQRISHRPSRHDAPAQPHPNAHQAAGEAPASNSPPVLRGGEKSVVSKDGNAGRGKTANEVKSNHLATSFSTCSAPLAGSGKNQFSCSQGNCAQHSSFTNKNN